MLKGSHEFFLKRCGIHPHRSLDLDLTVASTLIAIRITTGAQERQQSKRESFESKEKQRDRIMALRKEVYLPLAAALTEANAFLFSLPNQLINDPLNQAPLTALGAAISRLIITSDTETAVAAQKVAGGVGKLYFVLVELALPITQADARAKIFRKHKEKAELDRDRVYLDITKFNEAANTDEAIFNAKQRSQAWFQEQSENWAAKEMEALSEFQQQQFRFARTTAELIQPFAADGIALLLRIREDLGLKTDTKSLTEALDSGRKEMLTAIHELVAKMEQMSTS